MAYEFKNSRGTTYYLHQKEVILRGSKKKQMIFYFGKQAKAEAIDAVPEGYKVVESKKTGMPVLKRK